MQSRFPSGRAQPALLVHDRRGVPQLRLQGLLLLPPALKGFPALGLLLLLGCLQRPQRLLALRELSRQALAIPATGTQDPHRLKSRSTAAKGLHDSAMQSAVPRHSEVQAPRETHLALSWSCAAILWSSSACASCACWASSRALRLACSSSPRRLRRLWMSSSASCACFFSPSTSLAHHGHTSTQDQFAGVTESFWRSLLEAWQAAGRPARREAWRPPCGAAQLRGQILALRQCLVPLFCALLQGLGACLPLLHHLGLQRLLTLLCGPQLRTQRLGVSVQGAHGRKERALRKRPALHQLQSLAAES